MKPIQPNQPNAFMRIKEYFRNEILIGSFLVFIIEELVFITYNFHHSPLNHGIFVTSLIISIIYLVIILVCLIYVLLTPLSWDDFLDTDQIEGFYF